MRKKIYSVTELRRMSEKSLERLLRSRSEIVITRYRKPIARIIPYKKYQNLCEQIDTAIKAVSKRS